MKIAIHHCKGSYSQHWIDYCNSKKVPYKVVNCYKTDIIKELEDCDALMWHHNHADPRDVLFAKQLLYSIEAAGKVVYPDSNTTWHFDDKLGQKYLLEALELPLVNSYAFYSRKEAMKWLLDVNLPLVLKLRGGAGSRNVKLIRTRFQAKRAIRKAFGFGFRQYDAIWGIKENLRNFVKNKTTYKEVLKAFAHLVIPIKLEKSKGREKGYIYFQEYVPDCKFDIRVQIVDDKCYAMYRYVRNNDFRASGSGKIDYDGSKVPVSLIKNSFEYAKKLKMQSVAFDFVPVGNKFKIVEICYAWGIADGELEPGYWDSNLNWHPGRINPFGWIVDEVIKEIHAKTN